MHPRTYRLTVAGELDDRMGRAFPGMTLTRSQGETSLTGQIEDQAQLQGVLRRLTDFGLELIETKALPDHTPDPNAPVPHTEGT